MKITGCLDGNSKLKVRVSQPLAQLVMFSPNTKNLILRKAVIFILGTGACKWSPTHRKLHLRFSANLDPGNHTRRNSFTLLFFTQISQKLAFLLLLIRLLCSISILNLPSCLVCNLHLHQQKFRLRKAQKAPHDNGVLCGPRHPLDSLGKSHVIHARKWEGNIIFISCFKLWLILVLACFIFQCRKLGWRLGYRCFSPVRMHLGYTRQGKSMFLAIPYFVLCPFYGLLKHCLIEL